MCNGSDHGQNYVDMELLWNSKLCAYGDKNIKQNLTGCPVNGLHLVFHEKTENNVKSSKD